MVISWGMVYTTHKIGREIQDSIHVHIHLNGKQPDGGSTGDCISPTSYLVERGGNRALLPVSAVLGPRGFLSMSQVDVGAVLFEVGREPSSVTME